MARWITKYLKYKFKRMLLPQASKNKNRNGNLTNLGLIPGLGRSPGEGKGYPLQYSGLENSTDRGAWKSAVHGVPESWVQLSDFHSYVLLSMEPQH